MKIYKLTDDRDRTYGKTQWGEGITHETNGQGDLCGPGWIHAYEDLLLAVMLNPIHASFIKPHLWEAEGDGETKLDHGLKIGVTKLTTIRRLDAPAVTPEHRIRFAILCAAKVYANQSWRKWAQSWLDGSDTTAASSASWAAKAAEAEAAAEAAAKAAEATEATAASSASWAAAASASSASWAAAEAAAAKAAAAKAAEAAAEAAASSAWAAEAAAEAAAAEAAAAEAAANLDLSALVRQAVSDEKIIL